MLNQEPATHKKELRHFRKDSDLLTFYEIGIAYHHGRYTPTIAYFVSLNGKGKKFTGNDTFKAYMRALACYEATAEDMDAKFYEHENN